jgi:hypothetical protein
MSRRKFLLKQAERQALVKQKSTTPRETTNRIKVLGNAGMITRAERSEGQIWRDRLASVKALLGLGTETACREALVVLERFLDAAISIGEEVSSSTNTNRVTDRESQQTAKRNTREASKVETDAIGEAELRASAQCIVLLLRVSSQEATVWRRRRPTGPLVRTLELCAKHSVHSTIQSPLIGAGLIGILASVFTAHVGCADDAEIILNPALQVASALTSSVLNQMQPDQLPALVTAFLPLLLPSSSTTSRVSEQAASTIWKISTLVESLKAMVNAGVVAELVRTAQSPHTSTKGTVDVLRALVNISAHEENHIELIRAGAIQASLAVLGCSAREETPFVAAPLASEASLDLLCNLVECAPARKTVVLQGGVKVTKAVTYVAQP